MKFVRIQARQARHGRRREEDTHPDLLLPHAAAELLEESIQVLEDIDEVLAELNLARWNTWLEPRVIGSGGPNRGHERKKRLMYLSDDMTPEELADAATEQRAIEAERLSNYRRIWDTMPTLEARIAAARGERFQPPEHCTREFKPRGPWAVPDEEDTFPDTCWF